MLLTSQARIPRSAPALPTPITAELVVRAAGRLGEVVVDGDAVCWSESRPAEGGRSVGRSVIVWRSRDGTVAAVLPAPWNARTRVHEYGGGARTVADRTPWFTEFSDQRLYRLDAGSDTRRGDPRAGRARPGPARRPEPHRGGVLAVRETHPASCGAADAVNEIVRVTGEGTEVLVSGPDFVSDPRLVPDGVTLSWLRWNHPDMRWDAAQPVVRASDGADHVLGGGPGESLVQPTWGEDLALCWFSDRTNFWSLYRKRPHASAELVVDVGADIAGPQRVFGQTRFTLLADGGVAFAYGREGADRLAVLETDGSLRELDVSFTTFRHVTAQGTSVVRVAGSRASRWLQRVHADGGEPEIPRPARDLGLAPGGPRYPSTSPSRPRTPAPVSERSTRWSTRRRTRRTGRGTASCRRCWSSTAGRRRAPSRC